MGVLSIFDLTGKVAIITGGSRGIGSAIAKGFAEAGADVLICARKAPDLQVTSSEIKAMGRQCIPIVADVRNEEEVEKMVERALQEFGKVDILVNNAGGTFMAPLLDLSERGWDAVIRENLKSIFLCSKAVAREMIKEGKGSIINMSSVAGIQAYNPSAPYGAAKAGIINLTQTMALQWGPCGIRINAIAPGFIETPGTKDLYTEEERERRKNLTPLRRVGRPEDIIGAAVFLASNAADFVTGATIVVSGGFFGPVI
jgi:NAD(P)-dependent dehydrogenase (short-subunit alcohol dehydrogenase family)